MSEDALWSAWGFGYALGIVLGLVVGYCLGLAGLPPRPGWGEAHPRPALSPAPPCGLRGERIPEELDASETREMI